MLVRGALVMAALAVLVSCGKSASPAARHPDFDSAMGTVSGGIIPCEGMLTRSSPRYAAGSVAVLKGLIGQRPIPGGYSSTFPTRVVAKQSVGRNAIYRFTLPPGRYVLRATFPPPANVHPFTQVTLRRAATIHADIPNMCM